MQGWVGKQVGLFNEIKTLFRKESILIITDLNYSDVFHRIGRESEKKLIKDPQQPPLVKEDCCFSIIHGERNKSLDLIASDAKTALMWVNGFKSLLNTVRTHQSHQRGNLQ